MSGFNLEIMFGQMAFVGVPLVLLSVLIYSKVRTKKEN